MIGGRARRSGGVGAECAKSEREFAPLSLSAPHDDALQLDFCGVIEGERGIRGLLTSGSGVGQAVTHPFTWETCPPDP